MPEQAVQICAAVFGLLGTALLASRGPLAGWGFVLYLASNAGWLAFSWWRGLWPLFWQTVGFTVSSLWGVWVWLLRPWLQRCALGGDLVWTGEEFMRLDDLELATEPGAVLEQIQTLRRDFCAAVTLVCDDADTGHTAVEVMADWTAWQLRRFEGPTLAMCLARAMKARAQAMRTTVGQEGGAA